MVTSPKPLKPAAPVKPATRARPRVPSGRAGVALSPLELCATPHGARGAAAAIRRVPLEPFAGDAATWPALARALADVKASLGCDSIAVSLMPPLTEMRSVELPPLRPEEAERVLARNAGKYFVGARQAQLVGVAHGAKRGRASGVVVAAAAPARLIAAIIGAARDAGLVVDGIGPAESAWAAAATSIAPALGRGTAFVVVPQLDRTDLLRLADGGVDALRHFRAGAADADRIAVAVDEVQGGARSGTRVALIGAREQRADLGRALAERGVQTVTGAEGDEASRYDVAAARFAAPRNGPGFRTEDARVTWRRDAWRATGAVAAAAFALALVGAAVELWGVHRQLRLVKAERAALAPRLSQTLIGRSSVEVVYHHLQTLAAAERSSPDWSRAIGSLSDALPDGAYIAGLHTRDDSLIIDGLADQAADAFNAIAAVPELANVRSTAPVRRELQDDTTALERFTVAARVIQPGAPPPVLPAPRTSPTPAAKP